jgi:transcriptional regulator with XRE-family HTH domain
MKKIVKLTEIRKRRISLGLSQGDLATRIGVAVSSIGGYERAENPLSSVTASKMSRELGVPVSELFVPHKIFKNKLIAK